MDIKIQQYLQDEKIPFQNRKNMAVDLDTGAIDENTALKVLETKYPQRYGVPQVTTPQAILEVEPMDVETVEEEPTVSTPKISNNLMAGASNIIGGIPGLVDKAKDMFIKKAPSAEPSITEKAAGVVSIVNPLMPKIPTRNELLIPAADKLAKKYNWTEKTKNAFLNMDEEDQNKMMEAFGEDTLLAQIKAGALDATGRLAGLMYEGTAKPIIEHTTATAKLGQGILAALPDILKKDYAGAVEKIDKISSGEVEMFGENYNPLTAAYDPETGTYNEERLQEVVGGQTMQSVAGAQNLASLIAGYPLAGGFFYNALAGSLTAAGKDIEKGESVPTAIIDGAVGGLVQGVIGKIGGLAHKAATKDVLDKQLLKKQVAEDVRNIFKNSPTNQKIAVEYLDDAIYHIQDKTKNPSVWSKPSAEVNQFLDDLTKLKSAVGKQVSTAKESLKGINVDPKPVLKPIEDFAKSTGANIVQSGKVKMIDWAGSDLAAAPKTTLNLIDDIYLAAQKKAVDARALESYTSIIDQFTGQLKASGIKPSTVNTGLSQIKSTINQTIANYSDDFAKVNKDYAIIKSGYDQIQQAMKVGSGKNITYDSTQMLTRLLNRNGLEKYGNVFQTIDDLGRQYGLKVPENLQQKAWLAYWAENVTGGAPARATENVMAAEGTSAVGQAIGGVTGKAVKLAGEVASKTGFKSATPIADYATSLKTILENALKTGNKLPSQTIYKALEVISNIERVAKNPLTPPTIETVTEDVYGENVSPESYTYEEPYIAEEYTGL